MRRPIGIDLFAGAGGFSLGFEQAGFDVAAAVEIDPIHCATHARNFPDCRVICASVVDLTGDAIRKQAQIEQQDIDVIFGGAPCQGFSMMGKRALDDPRNQLVFHFVRLVKELAPKYVVFENVKGLTLGRHKIFLDELIDSLDSVGYEVVLPYAVLNASQFGVPQDRQRLFIMASRKGLCQPRYPQPNIVSKVTVWEAIGDLPDADAFACLAEQDCVQVSWNTAEPYAQRLRGLVGDPGDFSEPRRFDPNQLTSSLRTSHSPVSQARFAATEHGATEGVSHYRKLPPNGLCNTLRAGTDSARGAFTSPRPIHPHLPRVITVREAARLHSYPDWFRFHTTKWHGFRQIGNSVPPLLGRAIATQVGTALGYEPQKPQAWITLGQDSLLSMDMTAASQYYGVPHNTIAQRRRAGSSHAMISMQQNALPL